jgi:hypothetical protein
MFVETAANQPPRYFCVVCVIGIAAGYLSKAQVRKVQQAEQKRKNYRRPLKAPEATQ